MSDNTNYMKSLGFKPGLDFYTDENGLCVFTETFHKKRGNCCGSGCRHCPYFPRHQKGARVILE